METIVEGQNGILESQTNPFIPPRNVLELLLVGDKQNDKLSEAIAEIARMNGVLFGSGKTAVDKAEKFKGGVCIELGSQAEDREHLLNELFFQIKQLYDFIPTR